MTNENGKFKLSNKISGFYSSAINKDLCPSER